jgi:2-polyprenyl-3-methyl-5-hydroxy-6-metoxy-1,4-benzoquinol methylase
VAQTQEPQYQGLLDLRDRQGLTSLGLATNVSWHDDPKRLAFTFSRYKFVAKMFSGMQRVLEAGCGDAFGTRIVRQEVPYVMAVDFDPLFIEDVRRRMDPHWSFDCQVHDMLCGPVGGGFDGFYSLDVLEHVRAEDEDLFMSNAANSLVPHGAAIIGMPSLESQVYATPRSKAGHINCKTAPGLRELLQRFFHRVFIFSMNDEVVHTGFYPMASYLIGLCCDRK